MSKAILIQSRLSSSRFPEKMLNPLGDMTLVEYVYHRCRQSKKADEVMIITSIEKSDDKLYKLCIDKGIPVFRGDLNDVLKRYISAGEFLETDTICRVCGDSPFVDINAIDSEFEAMEIYDNLDYIATKNSLNGFMSETFALDLLQKVYNYDLTNDDREHVTKYIRDNISKFDTNEIDLGTRPKNLETFTLTVDYEKDLEIAEKIVQELDGFDFTSIDVLSILEKIKDEI